MGADSGDWHGVGGGGTTLGAPASLPPDVRVKRATRVGWAPRRQTGPREQNGLWRTLYPVSNGAHLSAQAYGQLVPVVIISKRWLGVMPQSTLGSPDGLGRGGNPCRDCHEVIGTSTPSTLSEPGHLGPGCRPPNPKPRRAPQFYPCRTLECVVPERPFSKEGGRHRRKEERSTLGAAALRWGTRKADT